MLGTLTVVGVVVLAVLTWFFFRTRRQDQIEDMLNKHKAGAKVASRADYVEGIERIPVALWMASETIYYQNPDLDASFELSMVDEVEYDDELATGKSVPDGARALRLRAHGRAIEFVMTSAEAQRWQSALPPHRTDDAAHAV